MGLTSSIYHDIYLKSFYIVAFAACLAGEQNERPGNSGNIMP